MDADSQTLSQTDAATGLSILLLARRRAIDTESIRFTELGDAEALHDLRVAMRRLHSLFIAFAPVIDPAVTLPEELRRVQKTSNHARDLEVMLAILRAADLQLPWLEQLWQRQLEGEYHQLQRTLPAAWQQLAPTLETPSQLLRDPLPPQTLGELAASLLQQRTRQLKKGRKALCRHWSDKPAHQLRIAGKQLRYLLEPFSEESRACAKAVSRLKEFQDLLGDYHDIVVLQKRLKKLQCDAPPEQLKPLQRARKDLKRRRRTLHRQFLQQNCGGKGDRLHQALLRAGQALTKQ